MSGFFIGIDVGGTNLKAGLTDETGRLLAAARRPWTSGGGDLCGGPGGSGGGGALHRRAVPGDAEGVGIGLPGAVSGGEVLYTTNIPLERTDLAALFPPAAGPAGAAGQRRGLCCRRESISGARAGVCGTSWC